MKKTNMIWCITPSSGDRDNSLSFLYLTGITRSDIISVRGGNILKIEFESPNSHGVFEVIGKKRNGDDILEPRLERCGLLLDGEVISNNLSPQFSEWRFPEYKRQFNFDKSVRYIEPMSAHEPKGEFKDDDYMGCISEDKKDGHRALMYIGMNGNRVFSRRVSKDTLWYNENSDCVPHIRDLNLGFLNGTVLDGEFDYGATSKEAQSVMGSLPHNAIDFQVKNGWIDFYAFDILYYKGINVQAMDLVKRKVYMFKALMEIWQNYDFDHIKTVKMYVMSDLFANFVKAYDPEIAKFVVGFTKKVPSFKQLFAEKVSEGLEGIMVKPISERYEQKRSRNFIKLKKKSTWDVVFMGLTEPEKIYTGKLIAEGKLSDWDYWYHPESDSCFRAQHEHETSSDTEFRLGQCVPVTKPFFMGWCGGIRFGVWDLVNWDELTEDCGGETHAGALIDQLDAEGNIRRVGNDTYVLMEVGVCKGLTEQVMEDIRLNADKYAKERRVLEVTAQEIINYKTGSLRHPRFKKWRDDKNHESCTFEDHIRLLKEEK
jgi:ATP dependent DNA ligase domain